MSEEAQQCYGHLQDLDLADPGDGHARPIDILAGANRYHDTLSGRVVGGGESGPVALELKLGWILCGPMSYRIDVQAGQTASRLLMTHVMQSPIDAGAPGKRIRTITDSLDEQLHQFWELEAIGIGPKAVYKEFKL